MSQLEQKWLSLGSLDSTKTNRMSHICCHSGQGAKVNTVNGSDSDIFANVNNALGSIKLVKCHNYSNSSCTCLGSLDSTKTDRMSHFCCHTGQGAKVNTVNGNDIDIFANVNNALW